MLEQTEGEHFQDPLSSILFNSVLDEVFRELEWATRGIKMDGKWLNNLRFVHYIVLISKNKEEVEKMLQELIVACRRWVWKLTQRKQNIRAISIEALSMQITKIQK